jgi:hypothetical protein
VRPARKPSTASFRAELALPKLVGRIGEIPRPGLTLYAQIKSVALFA